MTSSPSQRTWDICDFRDVLDRLKADGFYLFQGSLIESSDVAARTPKELQRH